MSKQTPLIGYVGVDVLNNATICNEATGLSRAGVRLEIVSVDRHPKPTFYRGDALAEILDEVESIRPFNRGELLRALLCAPYVFGSRFWKSLGGAIFGPAEGFRQRVRLAAQFLPALLLAMRWRNKPIRHIHAHWAHTATSVAMHAAGLLGIGFSFTGHANDLFVHRVGLAGKVRRARFIVCISEFHRDLYRQLGADPSRLKMVYCGIDTKAFRCGGRAGAIPSRPRVASVGRLVEKKGYHHLIAACARLRDEGLDFECVIAGTGPELERLRSMVAEHGLETVVKLTGEVVLQEDLPGFLASSQVFALPCVRAGDGDMDGLPAVLEEAMLCGIPVISTRLVGIPDLVRDGETGLLVEPGDQSALAAALRRLIVEPETAAMLGESGREFAATYFDRDESVRRLARLFAWSAESPGNSAPDYDPPSAPEAAAAAKQRGVPRHSAPQVSFSPVGTPD